MASRIQVTLTPKSGARLAELRDDPSRQVNMSPDRRPREGAHETEPRHPSYDPSGDEPAGSNDGLPDRGFAGAEVVEPEVERRSGDQPDETPR
jgi:hypothetical protein